MNTQSMGLAVSTGASSGIGAVYADRLELNTEQNTPDSSSRIVLVGSSV
jgi:NADP-dependent 3-hydroxy acid dehydrogenase YdfG